MSAPPDIVLWDDDAADAPSWSANAAPRSSATVSTLARTFARYWSEFAARRRAPKTTDAYTPYEMRNVFGCATSRRSSSSAAEPPSKEPGH